MSSDQYGRRLADRRPVDRLTRGMERLSQIRWQPVAAGQFLLLASGAITVLTTPLLRPTMHAWVMVAVVSAAMTVTFGATLAVDWNRLPARAMVFFPCAIWVALAVLGLTTQGIAPSYAGLTALCFAYVGLTQPPGCTLALLPVAVPAYICAFGGWSPPLLARLIIAVAVWTVLGELLAAFSARQAALSLALQSAAHTDALTGIGNRRDLHLRLAAARPGDTVVVCDLDRFKDLNDTLGHLAGDQVLADFGMLLRTCLRSEDYPARFGGEEFVLLLPAESRAGVSTVLRRLHESWAVLQPTITFSSGSAVRAADTTPEQTLQEADSALYAAKRAGRDRDFWAHATSDRPARAT